LVKSSNCYLKVPTGECFEHAVGVIGLAGAEIRPFKCYQVIKGKKCKKCKNLEAKTKAKAAANGANSFVLPFVLPSHINMLYNFNSVSCFKVQIHDSFKHSFSSIRAKMAELEPFEKCAQKVHIYKHFEHGFGSIRAILVELKAFQNLTFYRLKAKAKAATNGANSLFFELPFILQFLPPLDERFPYLNEDCQTGLIVISNRSYKTVKPVKSAKMSFDERFPYYNINEAGQTGLMGIST
jgi:hypothetical protein